MSLGSRRNWLFVDAAAMFGGHEVMLLRWIEELASRPDSGVRPRLLARAGSRLHELAPAPTRVPAFPVERSGRLARPWRLWRDALALRRAIRAEQAEWLVFASGALGSQVLLVMLARLWGARVLVYVPLLGTFESMGYRLGWLKDLFVRLFYAQLPHGWVAITAGQAAQFQAWAQPRGPVHVLPNTVAREIEQAPRLVPQDLAGDGRLRVLVLGRMEAWQKGLDLLVEHLAAAPAELRDRLRVSLVGEGPYRAVVEARCAADPALARCIVLGGWMPAREALAAQDVLLLPSRFEGVPLVMLEAMALGLPVVGADLPGLRAYLPDGQLFPVGDMARALARLEPLRDRQARERAASAGREAYEAGASSLAFAQAVDALTRTVRIVEASAARIEPSSLRS